MKRDLISPPTTAREAYLRTALNEACDAIERNAREAFVVNGQPSAQLQFEAVWQVEDPEGFWQWWRLKIRALAGSTNPTVAEVAGSAA